MLAQRLVLGLELVALPTRRISCGTYLAKLSTVSTVLGVKSVNLGDKGQDYIRSGGINKTLALGTLK